MTPDKTLIYDALLVAILTTVAALVLIAHSCSDSAESAATADNAPTPLYSSPLEECAEDIYLLHPRHKAILVHGSPRRQGVSRELAAWYCRQVGVEAAERAMRSLRPLTAEEVATW